MKTRPKKCFFPLPKWKTDDKDIVFKTTHIHTKSKATPSPYQFFLRTIHVLSRNVFIHLHTSWQSKFRLSMKL